MTLSFPNDFSTALLALAGFPTASDLAKRVSFTPISARLDAAADLPGMRTFSNVNPSIRFSSLNPFTGTPSVPASRTLMFRTVTLKTPPPSPPSVFRGSITNRAHDRPRFDIVLCSTSIESNTTSRTSAEPYEWEMPIAWAESKTTQSRMVMFS